MVQTSIKLSGYLLLWLALFLGKTLYPHARSFYEGVRGTEHAWSESFREHKRLQHFLTLLAPWTDAANRHVFFAYGSEAEWSTVATCINSTRDLLYPAHMFTHATTPAVFQWGTTGYADLPLVFHYWLATA